MTHVYTKVNNLIQINIYTILGWIFSGHPDAVAA